MYGGTGSDIYIITGFGKSDIFETSGANDRIVFLAAQMNDLTGEQYGNDLWISTYADLADGVMTSGTIIKNYFLAGIDTVELIED